jgi:hypothetical protein
MALEGFAVSPGRSRTSREAATQRADKALAANTPASSAMPLTL